MPSLMVITKIKKLDAKIKKKKKKEIGRKAPSQVFASTYPNYTGE